MNPCQIRLTLSGHDKNGHDKKALSPSLVVFINARLNNFFAKSTLILVP